MWFPPFSEREEWNDVTPIPQDDGPDPVVPIRYSAQFRETMDYFRAILEADERSERALELTEAVINLNAANYTVWAFRRACLDALGRDWTEELQWVTDLAADNPKNYQIWQHRRCCVEKCGNAEGELLFLNDFLTDPHLDDAKNYHAWAHRQWVVKRFQLWEEDKAFVEQLLVSDVRNNSAWNQRFFIVQNSTDMGQGVRAREIEWALDKAQLAATNESVWAFIRGMLLSDSPAAFPPLQAAVDMYAVRDPPVASALELKALSLSLQGGAEAVSEARKAYERLALHLDPIRKKYWLWKASKLGAAES
mmetsp:Transcript_1018/g.2380  ORF Transcript_1018/g.2380 Transcript_1018/m.2380 type:complete len:307 (+) Transcript_1018:89-1009(+)|eukprot:CAMPEP_0177722480 /NCGR_PEP_ID=MMETSP0484_2-20121128/17702_1 /TAXON_ID=354590 /ORGANISM="Rhodomonas lens, Strain RHODO" /LENGTH=306 /DNA_ID=CAMNT_0019234853 /DNA_START=89 /DNA_END=1009 /DNA_ORIENTATION=+